MDDELDGFMLDITAGVPARTYIQIEMEPRRNRMLSTRAGSLMLLFSFLFLVPLPREDRDQLMFPLLVLA